MSCSDASSWKGLLEERQHGGVRASELAALGVNRGNIIDFSVSVNPFGPSPRVREAVRSASIEDYPDPECTQARRVLAEHCNTTSEHIALGHGACELLWTLARMFGTLGRKALVVEPTFSEYAAAVRSTGARVVPWRAREEDEFDVDMAGVAERARREGAYSVYLCSPSSPVGRPVSVEAVTHLARDVAPNWVVLDQAFLSLSDRHEELSATFPENVLQVRSLTKELGTPGVRVGYLIAPAAIVQELERHRPRWTVSAAAQAAAQASCADREFLCQSRGRLHALREQLMSHLQALGLRPVASVANYCVAKTPILARELRQTLLQNHGVLVRDCGSFGLPYHIRLGVRPAEDLVHLSRALESELGPRSFRGTE